MQVPAWLFVRGSESVWVQRSEEAALQLTVLGPGSQRGVYSFASESELQDFQGKVESRLVHAGWVLEAFTPERRRGGGRRYTERVVDRVSDRERRRQHGS